MKITIDLTDDQMTGWQLITDKENEFRSKRPDYDGIVLTVEDLITSRIANAGQKSFTSDSKSKLMVNQAIDEAEAIEILAAKGYKVFKA